MKQWSTFFIQNSQLIINLRVSLGSICVPIGVLLLQKMAEDIYVNLREKLEEQGGWPQPYLFKFIVPSDNKKIALVEAIFEENTQVTLRQSKSNKFTSISAKEVMMSPDEVIAIYKKAAKVEGIMSL